jgi:predicted Zn-dependent protease
MTMEGYFHDVAAIVGDLCQGSEIHLSNFHAEDSDFVRFNHGRVRQAGAVTMRSLSIDLVRDRRHACGSVSVCGDLEIDRSRIKRLVERLRETCRHVPEDPFLRYATEPRSTSRRGANRLPSADDAFGEVHAATHGHDFVGIYAAGGIYCGFANSLGQRNWYAQHSYHLDWSLVAGADKAVAVTDAGCEWRPEAFERRVAAALEQLELLSKPPRDVSPGRYRVYLAPAALAEFMGLLGWGGFGLRAHRTKTTPLLRMIEEGVRLDRRVRLTENTRDGLAPDFQEEGFLRPDAVPLIEDGVYRECLISPRSAAEYGTSPNGATASEMPQSLDISAGTIPQGQVTSRLGTGIYVGNVWYLNYSDRAACRTTGMTRFATYWIEKGRLQAPLNVMRFDETVYRMLGANLIELTDERDWIVDSSTYSQRSTATTRLPGALIDDFTLTS